MTVSSNRRVRARHDQTNDTREVAYSGRGAPVQSLLERGVLLPIVRVADGPATPAQGQTQLCVGGAHPRGNSGDGEQMGGSRLLLLRQQGDGADASVEPGIS